MKLRPYQQAAVDSAYEWMLRSLEPCVIEAATGSGKSLLIAELTKRIRQASGKRCLVMAPSAEIVKQNHEKYVITTKDNASIFSASAGSKSAKYPVVFGSPLTVKNHLEKFKDNIALVVMDEAHNTSKSVKEIINHIRENNPNCRVLGLTATPYRLLTGYIYQYDTGNKPVEAIEPFYHKLVYSIGARDLIQQGYLTPPTTEVTTTHYDTSHLVINTMGKFTSDSLSEAVGDDDKTSLILKEVQRLTIDRHCCIVFASTIEHAQKINRQLPDSMLITGSTKKKDRAKIIQFAKAGKIKYLINVGTLTTGVDIPIIDTVAILRPTESASLYQQIVGRGLRLHEGKDTCLVLDYAENFERHCPDGDIFNPEIVARQSKKECKYMEVICPTCDFENSFKARPNDEGYGYTECGYFKDLAGNKMDIPSHYGRRCQGYSLQFGKAKQCYHRWNSKECEECGHHNDIAAKKCERCKAELVDPNEKLRLDFQRMKKDPYTTTTDKVLSWQVVTHQTKSGKESIAVTYKTECRTFKVWYLPSQIKHWKEFVFATCAQPAMTTQAYIDCLQNGYVTMPKTVTVSRKEGSPFYTVHAYNKQEDLCETLSK